jgi:hypothetical protein
MRSKDRCLELFPLFLVLIAGLISQPCSAEYFGYSPQYNDLALGKGITGVDFANPHAPCVKVEDNTTPLHQSKTIVDASIVTNQKDLEQALNIDAKASASYLGMGGGGEFKTDEEFSQSEASADIVLEAVQEVDGTTFASQPVWNAPYDNYAKPETSKLYMMTVEIGTSNQFTTKPEYMQ